MKCEMPLLAAPAAYKYDSRVAKVLVLKRTGKDARAAEQADDTYILRSIYLLALQNGGRLGVSADACLCLLPTGQVTSRCSHPLVPRDR